MVLITIAILGFCLGSFINAFVWRLHELETRKKLSDKQRKELSFVRGRSMCIYCRHELAWYDLLPVLSWLSLKGRCRYCGKPISWQYPLVELLTATAFVHSYTAWSHGFDTVGWILFVMWLIFVTAFMALAVYDLKWMQLPNKIVYPLIFLAFVQVILRGVVENDVLAVVVSAFWGFLVIGGLFYALFQLSGGKWIGGGDVKLAFMIGPLVGSAAGAFLVIFFASLLGTIASLPLLLLKSLKTDSRISFGPFLLMATYLVYLYGERIIDWYTLGLY